MVSDDQTKFGMRRIDDELDGDNDCCSGDGCCVLKVVKRDDDGGVVDDDDDDRVELPHGTT